MKMSNEAMEEILNRKDLNSTELNHLIYAAATVITEEINGTGKYKLETQRSKTPPWFRPIQGSINYIRKELSALVEIKRDNRKAQDIKRTNLLKKNSIEKKENLDQLTEELKQKVSTKTQQERNIWKKVKHNGEACWIKNGANEIQAWNRARM